MFRYFYIFFNVLLTFLVLTTPLSAQNLKGSIYDAETGEPLFGATVYGNDACKTTSDIEGEFQLPHCDADSLVVRYLGYEPQVIFTPFPKMLEFGLQKSGSLLDMITVTGSRYAQSAKKSIVSLESVNMNRIRRESSPLINDLLNKINGVQIVDGQANIRGGSGYSYGAGSRVMMILDGLPMLQGDASLANWRDMPTENIGNIEILKGASSIIYGSSALNGVINMSTLNPGSTPVTEFSLQHRIYDAPPVDSMKWWGDTPFVTNGSVVHRRKIGKLDLTGNAFYSKEESYFKGKTAETLRLGTKIRYRFKPELIAGLNVNFNDYEGNSPFYWENYGEGTFIADTSAYSLTDAIRYTIDPYLSYYDRSGGHHKLSSRYYSVENNTNQNRSNKSQSYLSEYQYFKDIHTLNLKFTGGILFSRMTSDSELFSNSEFTQDNLAAYAQIEKNIGESLIFQAGIRYENNRIESPDTIPFYRIDQSKNKHSETVGRLGLNYSLGEYSQLRASWGQGYRYPAIAERYINTNIGIPIAANPNLKPETGWTAEIGFRQGFKMGALGGFADLSFFQMEYENMMEFVAGFINSTGTFGFQAQNIGNTRIRGLDCQVQSQVDFSSRSSLEISLGYNYIDPKFKDFTEDIKRRSSSDKNVLKYRQKHHGKAHLFWKYKNLGLGTTYQLLSKTEAIDLIFYILVVEGAQDFDNEHNDTRHILDFIVSYSFKDDLTLRLNVKNITNELYTLRPALPENLRSLSLQLSKKWEHKKS